MLYSPQLANTPRADLDMSLFWSVVLLLSIFMLTRREDIRKKVALALNKVERLFARN